VNAFSHPFDVLRNVNKTVAGAGGFWIVFSLDNRIEKIDWKGSVVFETSRHLGWDLPRTPDGKIIPEYPIHGPSDADPRGNLYVVYSTPGNWRQKNEVYKYGPDGRLHGKVFTLPVDAATMIRFDRHGKFYFSDGSSLYIAEIMVEEVDKIR
jgi:hypothetical protein